MSTWANLLAVLGGIPRLDGAACVGLHEAFDPPRNGEHLEDQQHRYQSALRICARCPALTDCRQWFDSLPRRQQPHGVIAGQLNLPRPAGRPSKAPGSKYRGWPHP